MPKIKDKDLGWKKLKKLAKEVMQAPSVSVGILEEDMKKPKEVGLSGESSEKRTLGEVAIYNEFGTEDIPARSFVRAPFDETNAFEKLRKSLWGRLTKGQITVEQALDILGSGAAKTMIKRINDGIDPENAEITAERKGSDTPLIETGQLIEHITYKVNKSEK